MTNGRSGLSPASIGAHALTLDPVVILGLLMARLQGCIKCGIRIGLVANRYYWPRASSIPTTSVIDIILSGI